MKCTVTRPVFQLVAQDPATVAKIHDLETQVNKVVNTIMNSKLNYHDVTFLRGVPEEVIKAMAEHAIATNSLKHALHKARNNRIKEIKKGA